MAAKSNLVNMALCLTLVCLFCSAVLAGVYALTAEPIAEAARVAQENAIKAVLPDGGSLCDAAEVEADGAKLTYYRYADGDSTIAYAVRSSAVGFGGVLNLMVGVLPDGTVYNTTVLMPMSETPGLGAKCQSDEAFLGQFRGLAPGSVLKVRSDGGDIDAITASTITSRAYVKAVAQAVAAVSQLTAAQAVCDGSVAGEGIDTQKEEEQL